RDDVDFDRAELRRLTNGEIESYEVECRFVHRSGRMIWVQLNVSAIRNIQGRPFHYVCQVHDITVRKANEGSLQRTTAKLTLAMDMARLGYWEFDVPQGRLTLDEGCHRLFGTTAAEFRKLHWSIDDYCREFLPLADGVVFRTELRRALTHPATALPRQLNHLFNRRDQSSGIMAVRFSTLEDGAGRIVKVYGVNQDMSETKRMEHQQRALEVQLRHAQRLEAIGTLAGGVAHEFNNLLTAIMGNIQLAEIDLADGREPQACLREATNSCREARDLVNRLLTFSQQAQPLRRALPFASVVQTALEEVARDLPTTIQLQVAIGSSSPMVRCDALEIGQVLQQISTNAAHAMVERGGVLDVSLRHLPPDASWRERYPQVDARHTVCLSFRDTGIGMSPSLLNRVFDPFFTTKPFGQGAGLGLPMVRGIMKRHGGSVVIESSPGSGTTVHILFPEAPADYDTNETRT
ncbi:MAG: ATP-binding protein, partial [Opitutus sp.]